MSPLAIILQVAICGAVVIGAMVYLAGLAIHDYLHPSMSAMLGLGGELLPDDEAVCDWCGGAGCDLCDPEQWAGVA